MKYVLTILITALVVGLGVVAYFKGWIPNIPPNKPQAVSVGNTEISNTSVQLVTTPSIVPSPVSSASPSASTTVQAGGVLVFKGYTVSIPVGWKYVKSGSSDPSIQMDVLTITNGNYKITINQSASGGSQCLYPGDPSADMSVTFTSFAPVTTASGDSLRVGLVQPGAYTVCQNQNNSWGTITSYGHIDISAPATPMQTMLDQINSILASIKKI